jgi:hypothetical protein
VEKPEGKRPTGRPGRRWEDNIKMNLPEFRLGKAWNEFVWLRTGTRGQSAVKNGFHKTRELCD